MSKKVASFSNIYNPGIKRSQCVLFRVSRQAKMKRLCKQKKGLRSVMFYIYTTDYRCLETQLSEAVKGVFVNMLCPWLGDRVVGVVMI